MFRLVGGGGGRKEKYIKIVGCAVKRLIKSNRKGRSEKSLLPLFNLMGM